MKITIQSMALFLILFGMSMDVQGQRGRYGPPRQSNCIICSAGVGVGWYKPSLDYLNDESYLNAFGASFDGGIIATAGVEAKLYQNLYLGVSAGFWSDVAEFTSTSGTTVRTEELKISIVPISVALMYQWSFEAASPYNYSGGRQSNFLSRLTPFIGLGAGYDLITQDLDRVIDGERTTSSLKGTAPVYKALGGTKIAIVDRLDLGILAEYVLGSFDQQFGEGTNAATESVGLDGISAQLTLSFKL